MTPRRASNPVSPRRSLQRAGQEALDEVVSSGLLRCAVPTSLGGDGGLLDDLVSATALWRRNGATAAARWVMWAQRLAIEALLQSPNLALQHCLLPTLMAGERAGSVPFPADTPPLLLLEAARGLRVVGKVGSVPNLQWVGCTLIVPVRLVDHSVQWIALRTEEDGLQVGLDHDHPFPWGSRTADIVADDVWFRMDEWVCGSDLPERIHATRDALAPLID